MSTNWNWEAAMGAKDVKPVERLAYRPAEFARAAGVGITTVYEKIAAGEIPAVRLGSALMIPASWVHALLDESPGRC
jgi:excisionase family DNA binding protein